MQDAIKSPPAPTTSCQHLTLWLQALLLFLKTLSPSHPVGAVEKLVSINLAVWFCCCLPARASSTWHTPKASAASLIPKIVTSPLGEAKASGKDVPN